MGLTKEVGLRLRFGLGLSSDSGFFFFEFFGKRIGFGLFEDLMIKLLEVGIPDNLLFKQIALQLQLVLLHSLSPIILLLVLQLLLNCIIPIPLHIRIL